MHRRDKPKTGTQQNRSVNLAVRAVNADERRVTVSFSSEQSVDRWWGPEILAHDEGSINLDRLNQIGVSLFNHNRGDVLGKVENARCDTVEKRCYADIVFDKDERADLIFQKVQSGTLKGVSVGYQVDVWEEVMTNKMSSNGRFKGPCYVATRWTPLEISIVSIPADETVGVGREMEEAETVPASGRADNTNSNEEDETMKRKFMIPFFAPDNGAGAGAGTGEQERGNQPPVGDVQAREAAVKAERQRASEITALCRDFGVDPHSYIDSGATVDAVRTAILEKLKTERQPSAVGTPDVKVEKEEADKIREAASDGIRMRAGLNVEKPADGARDFRALTLRDLAIECLLRAGVANAHRFDNDKLFREAITADSQFAAILSATVNKSMATAYNVQNTTYQAWTRKGSNPDFKGATVYQISEAGDLTKMTQSGEFKHDELQDNGVSKSIATFGRKFSISRQALINDDIGILTRVPEAYVRSAKRGINKLVYSILSTNPTIYDGVALFHANHGNLGTAGAINDATLGEMKRLMRKQKNIKGLEVLNIAPAFLIVSAKDEIAAMKILNDTALQGANQNSGAYNPWRNSMQLVVDAELDVAAGAQPWFTAANPSDIDTIEVTYLNGDDMPKLESRIGFDFLGMEWRIFIDYGVTVLDYRGLGKNAGV